MRLLAFAFLAVAAVSGREIKKICEPGTMTKEDCNDCRCSADGTFRTCTMMACDLDTRMRREATEEDDKVGEINHQNSEVLLTVPFPLRQRRQVSHNRPCVPGTQFKIYCNTCACGSDGFSVACTRMECDERVFNEDGSLKVIGELPNNEMVRQKRQIRHKRSCEPGKSFKMDCNTCWCGLDGQPESCTRMECPKGMYNEDGSRKQKRQAVSHNRPCEAGKQFKIYCNTCSCGSDGFSVACTRMMCPEGVYNEDGSLKNVGEVPNNTLLRQNGPGVSHNRPCEAGKQFKIYCNTCSCGSDGFSVACTRMMCPEGVYNEDGTLKNIGGDPNNALVRQKRQLSEGETCEPGKTFKDYCNTCTCGSDGVTKACTMMACDERVYNKDGSMKNVGEVPNNPLLRQKRQLSEGETCEPGKTFKDYCNTCTCGSDGVTKACTMMACDERDYNKDGSMKNVGEVPNNPLLRQKRQVSEGETCEPGKSFKDYCNTCTCGSDGVTKACTMMACDERVYNKDGSMKNVGEVPNNTLLRQKRQAVSHNRPCEAGKQFKIYCNTCSCGSDGFSVACTRMMCPEGVYNEDGSLKNVGEVPNNALLRQNGPGVSHNRPCEAGKQFKIYCNTCSCGSDGFSVACTRMMCPEGVYNEDGSLKNIGGDPKNAVVRQKRQLSEGETCEPGKSFKDYCNTCTCGADGVTKACTMMACDERVYNKDGSLKNVGEIPNNTLLRQKRQLSEGETCEPGKSFKDYCNTCTCGADGVTKACTMMACDERIYNKDGSMKNVGEIPKNTLLRQKRQLSEGETCEPGKSFKDYCNTCTCGSDGVTKACTMMACDERVYNKDGSMKNVGEVPNNTLLRQKRQAVSHNRPCEAGKQFKIYCNTCSCGSDGFSVACTRMMCPEGVYNEDGSLKNVGEVPNNALLRQNGPGVSHNRPCEAGKQFKIYCNTCSCGSDGFSVACTRMMCPEGVYNEDGSLKNIGGDPKNAVVRQKRQLSEGETCEPGKSFKDYCNTCTCGSDGVTKTCTIMACDERVYNKDGSKKNVGEIPKNTLLRQKRQLSEGETCEPGKSFKDYCNTCTCGADGVTKACTMMACDERVYNKDGSLKNVGEVPNNTLLRQKRQLNEGETCEPGKSFKDYCNTCTCGSDGVTKACTMMACDERVYNKDGSLKNLGEVPTKTTAQ